MKLESLVGQTLDGKYLIEKELGRGGMGAVFLATHLGTERPVALKVIAPQFMEREEFVERFRREARAAGRLRHPNVVDVTDFGFADTPQGRAAYLVMEYLDGCSLGEILEEEKRLPLEWTLNIVEQVCSAVQAAHNQGIIHRDLKPDNIWLEPNQRGGYTVNVLDFGIAKLEEAEDRAERKTLEAARTRPTQALNAGETLSDERKGGTLHESRGLTVVEGGATLIQPLASGEREAKTALITPVEDEKGTAILTPAENFDEKGTAIMSPAAPPDEKGTAIMEAEAFADEKGTAIMSSDLTANESGTAIIAENPILAAETKIETALSQQHVAGKEELARNSAANLTKVGAVLGTPLYMSPEQCRGERLAPQSDVYSLGVIVYQMLAGKTPFEGSFTEVMEAHKNEPPPPLDVKGIPRKVKKVLEDAMSKDPARRPPSAEAFASELRSHSEGFVKLFQRALVIYSEHLPKFLTLGFLFMLPQFFFSVLYMIFGGLASLETISTSWGDALTSITNFVGFFAQMFASATLSGTVTWIVAQLVAYPLRPISLRKAFQAAWSKKKTLFPVTTVSSLIAMTVVACCFPLGFYLITIFMLVTPVVIMEDLKFKAAFARSRQLVNRSFATALLTAILLFVVPAGIGAAVGGGAVYIASQLVIDKKTASIPTQTDAAENGVEVNIEGGEVKISNNKKPKLTPEERAAKNLANTRVQTITQLISALVLTPIMALLVSFLSIMTALMYFKTRQAGGENMENLLVKFEDGERKESKWQQRMNNRLFQTGRTSSLERK